MGYRGSKSVTGFYIPHKPQPGTVKEQRVDGSWLLSKLVITIRSLRCTLMGFERNYQVKILTNQLIRRTYSTKSNNLVMNP